MKISEAIFWGKTQLLTLENPKLEAEVLLSEAMKKNRTFLFSRPENSLSESEEILYKKFVQKRKKKFPVAYIIGYKKWNDLKISVDKSVLIPRDETEVLAQKIIVNTSNPQKILDLGTGSGALAIFFQKKFPHAMIYASDSSQKALKIAKKNAKKNNISGIHFVRSNFFSNSALPRKYGLIVANLPYVPQNIPVSAEVFREPKTAIFSGTDGLCHYKKLALELKKRDIQFNDLWIEFLPIQKEKIRKIFIDYQTNFQTNCSEEIFFAHIRIKNFTGIFL